MIDLNNSTFYFYLFIWTLKIWIKNSVKCFTILKNIICDFMEPHRGPTLFPLPLYCPPPLPLSIGNH